MMLSSITAPAEDAALVPDAPDEAAPPVPCASEEAAGADSLGFTAVGAAGPPAAPLPEVPLLPELGAEPP
jgi:hypothetical protein